MAKWTAEDIPDQTGRTVLVTGANSGLGLHMSQVLVAKGARVLMACRSPERGEAAVVEVNEVAGAEGGAELVLLDLADLSSVKAAAADVRERTGDALDVLVNNAGVMNTPKRATADGFELQLGTNHIGHAAFTWLLMPALRTRPGARVVTLSSNLHKRGGLEVTDLNFERRSYVGWTAYAQSKVANLLFAFELDRRARRAGLDLVSVAAHPGYTDTDLVSNMSLSRSRSTLVAQVVDFFNRLVAQPVEQGVLPQLYAATAPDVTGGAYYGPDGFQELRGHPTRVRASRLANDPGLAARVWDLTAELSGVTPDPA